MTLQDYKIEGDYIKSVRKNLRNVETTTTSWLSIIKKIEIPFANLFIWASEMSVLKFWKCLNRWRNSMKMWITRTIGRDLQLFPEEPFYREEYDMWYYWKVWTLSSHILSEGSLIDPSLFPEVTFENSPMEVKLVIKKKEQA